MGQDVGLKCESRSRSRAAPEIIRPSCSVNEEMESQNRKAHASRDRHLKCSAGNLGAQRLECIPNFHCKSLPSRSRETNPEEHIVQKRGSMYQSSSEVSRIRKLREGRRKVDSAHDGDAFLSFEIVDSSSQPSTSGAYLYSQKHRSSEAKASVETGRKIHRGSREFLDLSFRDLPDKTLKPQRPRMDCTLLKDCAGDDFLEICLEEEISKAPRRNGAPELLERGPAKGSRMNCHQQLDMGTNGSNRDERDLVSGLPKSMSAKVGTFHHARPSESVVHGIGNNSKAWSSPFKKMLDPIMKSKSLKSPSLMEKENAETNAPSIGRKNAIPRKSLLSDFSRTEQCPATNCQPVGEGQVLSTASSPAHLHAILKLDSKNGIPVFDFSIKGREDTISAMTWKTGNELNWVYTFHGKRVNTTGRTSKDRHGCSPPILGQMQVSSYLCSEVGDDGILNNSAVTEFVLYDIAHARRSFAVEERTQCADSLQPPLCSAAGKLVPEVHVEKNSLLEQQHNGRNNSDVSTSCPWPQEDLYPHVEIAATVIQVPFNKNKSKESKAEAANPKVSSALSSNSCPGAIKVITPSGTHGLPSDEEASPSPLLERWRYGGGCDCGGWDMACPIMVLDSAYDSHWADSVMKESKQPTELFVQGSKEKLPALSMTADGKGEFSVDFHARLSALQAFSVCISLIHCSEASSDIGIEKCKHKLYSSSLKLLLEEEVRHLIEAVTVEEKKKPKKRRGKTPPSVVLDPPFSPLSRV